MSKIPGLWHYEHIPETGWRVADRDDNVVTAFIGEAEARELVADHNASLLHFHSKYRCVYCGGESFVLGPMGGLSINMLCANLLCLHWFNFMPGFGMDDLHTQQPKEDRIVVGPGEL